MTPLDLLLFLCCIKAVSPIQGPRTASEYQGSAGSSSFQIDFIVLMRSWSLFGIPFLPLSSGYIPTMQSSFQLDSTQRIFLQKFQFHKTSLDASWLAGAEGSFTFDLFVGQKNKILGQVRWEIREEHREWKKMRSHNFSQYIVLSNKYLLFVSNFKSSRKKVIYQSKEVSLLCHFWCLAIFPFPVKFLHFPPDQL